MHTEERPLVFYDVAQGGKLIYSAGVSLCGLRFLFLPTSNAANFDGLHEWDKDAFCRPSRKPLIFLEGMMGAAERKGTGEPCLLGQQVLRTGVAHPRCRPPGWVPGSPVLLFAVCRLETDTENLKRDLLWLFPHRKCVFLFIPRRKNRRSFFQLPSPFSRVLASTGTPYLKRNDFSPEDEPGIFKSSREIRRHCVYESRELSDCFGGAIPARPTSMPRRTLYRMPTLVHKSGYAATGPLRACLQSNSDVRNYEVEHCVLC